MTRFHFSRRTMATLIVVGTTMAAGVAPAAADHVHSRQVGNGSCVLLAQHGGEGDVDLPFASEALVAANRAHPLHLLVHLGEPGERQTIGVAGAASDPCIGTGSYLND